MAKLPHVEITGHDSDLGGIIVHTFRDALLTARDKVLPKGGLCRCDLTAVHQIAPQAEPSALQDQRLLLVGNERKPIGTP
jgi:hypothetical protein